MVAVLREKVDHEKELARAASLRAGLVAAAVYNVHRKKGSRALKPTDFVRTKPKELTPDQIRTELLGWAKAVNKGQAN